MDNFENASLGVGFDIDTGGSFEALARLDTAIDRAAANAIDEFNRVERASAGMLNLNGAQVGLRSFGAENTQAMRAAAREILSVEKAGERLVSQIERQSAAFGKTREEMRLAKVEAAALAAEQQGLTELAGRLRAADSELAGKELAAARRARFEAEALAQDREEAEAKAAAQAAQERLAVENALNAQLMERARLQAALEQNFGLNRGRATDNGATFSALAARAAEEEAQALRSAALAHDLFQAKVREGLTVLRAQEAAEKAATREMELMSVAAERIRASIDPAYAAQARYNQEIGESRALVAAGVLGLDEYCAKLRIEEALLEAATDAQSRAGQATRAHGSVMAAIAPQAQDFFTQWSMGANVLNVLAIQGGQAASQMIYLGGKAGAFASFMMGPWGLAIQGAMLALGALTNGLFSNSEASKKAEEGLKAFADRQKDISNFIDATTGSLAEQNKTLVLNAILTRQANMAANDKAISESRVKAFARAGRSSLKLVNAAPGTSINGMGFTDNEEVQAAIRNAGGNVEKLATGLATLAKTHPELAKVALDVSGIGGQAIIAQRENDKLRKELRALGGDTTALAQGSTSLIEKQVALATATTPLARARAELALVQQGAAAADKAGGAALIKYRTDLTEATKAVNAAEAAQKAANEARRDANRDANHAEKLGRDADAVQARTRNLYLLADAYGVSGAAALVAEARVKAESDAIRRGADIELVASEQVRLAIAQRVADGARGNATMDEQSRIQTEVNAAVANGIVPAERANELLRDRMAELPLLAALEAARARGLVAETQKAQAAIDALHAAQDRAKGADIGARFAVADTMADRRLAELAKEAQLIGAADAARTRALATLKATQEVEVAGFTGNFAADYVAKQVQIAENQQQLQALTNAYNDSLRYQADLLDTIAGNMQAAGRGMADAFGEAGRAIGDMSTVFAGHLADQQRLSDWRRDQLKAASELPMVEARAAKERQIATQYALRSGAMQINMYGDMASSAKGFFDQGSVGYKALSAAEQAFRAVQFAMSVRAMVQDARETIQSVFNSGARATAQGAEGVATQAKLPFPFNLAAMAATGAALVAAGIAVLGGGGGGGGAAAPVTNTGTGTTLGDSAAKSESLKRSIDALKEVDTVTSVYAREMASSLRSIDGQIGGLASLVVRTGNIDANAGVRTGTSGGILGSLFGSRIDVLGNGLFGGPQALSSILSNGFDASYYSDVQKTKKFLGIVTGRSTSTQYAAADAGLENQFTLILREFNNAIVAAAGPLGAATGEIQARLNGFVVDIGKIDLKGLTGPQIQEKLTAVFGAAADRMADSAFPGFQRFAKVGEGAFETLVRVASTVEAATNALNALGGAAQGLSIDAKMGLVAQFESVSAFSSATDAYFQAYYSKAEQSAAKTAQLAKVFDSLGLTMPASLSAFRSLVEAQNLSTTAGQATYATLIKLAPAFADLQAAMEGAKSAADIASERADLERKLLEVNGDTAALRALDLAKLDASNRALQTQIWAIQDAQEAAKAADELRKAWGSVGDSIMAEVKRIRGLTDASGGGTFASIMGQFNAANAAARGGDQDAAKLLPSLSQSLLTAAGNAATSPQELDRIRAQTAAQLEATWAAIQGRSTAAISSGGNVTPGVTIDPGQIAATSAAAPANDDLAAEMRQLREEVAQLRKENMAGHAATASNTGAVKKVLENVSAANGGQALSVAGAA